MAKYEITRAGVRYQCHVSFPTGKMTWDSVLRKSVPVMIHDRWKADCEASAVKTIVGYAKQILEEDISEDDIVMKFESGVPKVIHIEESVESSFDPLAEKLRKFIEA